MCLNANSRNGSTSSVVVLSSVKEQSVQQVLELGASLRERLRRLRSKRRTNFKHRIVAFDFIETRPI
eukprot:6210916-Amphidinium_carterae.1